MSSGEPGLDLIVERGFAAFRVTHLPGALDAPRLAARAQAQLATIPTKGLRGLLVDFGPVETASGPVLHALATAFGPVASAWEGRGLPCAIVAPKGRAQLEAMRIVATSAPRWGKVVATVADAERWLGVR